VMQDSKILKYNFIYLNNHNDIEVPLNEEKMISAFTLFELNHVFLFSFRLRHDSKRVNVTSLFKLSICLKSFSSFVDGLIEAIVHDSGAAERPESK
jgi:hypothetical protein